MADDALPRVIFEARQQLAPGADAGAIAARVKRLQLGLPAEDEFSMLLNWLGHCRLVHKLDQLQRPQESRKHLRVPDLLAIIHLQGA